MDLAAVAEDGFGYVVNRPGDVREVWPGSILTHSPSPLPEFGSASRIRLGSEVDDPVRDVRAWFASRDRARFVWSLGPSTTPTDLARRLLDLGAEPNPAKSEVTAMVLDREPPEAPGDVAIRRVETLEDYVAQWEIFFVAFEVPEPEREAVRATLEARWVELVADETGWTYLALIDGVPAALGRVRRTEPGPLWLAGGATLPSARGRGLYRALVRARWDDAVRLGASALVVQASDMSRPILERLGFRATGAIKLLIDRSAF
jgi:predicted N-acetyltransferase YhbS